MPKTEIIKNIRNYAKLSQEEAENYVNDPQYREIFKLPDSKEPEQETAPEHEDENVISKLADIENQLKEINKNLDPISWAWLWIGLGVLIGWLVWGIS